MLVRGRVDHKDREKTCLVVQQVERFEPSTEEVERAVEEAARKVAVPNVLRLRLDATSCRPPRLSDLKELLDGFPGEAEVVIELKTSAGPRRLKLGPDFRVARGAALHAELDALLGRAPELERERPRTPRQPAVAVGGLGAERTRGLLGHPGAAPAAIALDELVGLARAPDSPARML